MISLYSPSRTTGNNIYAQVCYFVSQLLKKKKEKIINTHFNILMEYYLAVPASFFPSTLGVFPLSQHFMHEFLTQLWCKYCKVLPTRFSLWMTHQQRYRCACPIRQTSKINILCYVIAVVLTWKDVWLNGSMKN